MSTEEQLQHAFEQAVQTIKDTPSSRFKPSNELKLQMYALYKQATLGDVQGKRPGLLDMVGRAKFDAWAKLKGTTQSQAMTDYLEVFKEINEKIHADGA